MSTSTATTTTTTTTKLVLVDLKKIDECEELKQSNTTNNHVNKFMSPKRNESENGCGGKIRSLSSSSTNSSINTTPGHNISSSNGEEDEERFYDAIEAEMANLTLNSININTNGNINSPNGNTSVNSSTNNTEVSDLEQFYDTKTSRHASEMSESSVLGQLSPRNLVPSSTLPPLPNENYDMENEYDDDVIIVDEEPIVKVMSPMFIANTDNTKQIPTLNQGIVCDDDDDDIDIDEEDIDAELETSWSFWIDRCVRGTSKDEYEAGLKLIYTFKTVQKFWSVFNNIPDVSMLPAQCNYHLMRNNRRPLWEDKENSQGGLWKLKCKKDDSSEVWREVLLAAIGEQLSDWVSTSDDVVGVSVGRREKDDIIQIWNLDYRHHSEAVIIKKLQELVPHVKFSAVFYKPHHTQEAYSAEAPSNFPNHSNNVNNANKSAVNNNNTNYHHHQHHYHHHNQHHHANHLNHQTGGSHHNNNNYISHNMPNNNNNTNINGKSHIKQKPR